MSVSRSSYLYLLSLVRLYVILIIGFLNSSIKLFYSFNKFCFSSYNYKTSKQKSKSVICAIMDEKDGRNIKGG